MDFSFCLDIFSLKIFWGGYSEEVYFKKINVRLQSIVIPYLFWNVFWLIYNIIKTYKLSGVAADTELLYISSIKDFFACFWEKGFGATPNFPIAGYTWYLRDLFVFALLSPIYNYCYKNSWICIPLIVVLVVCESVPNWHIPGLNTWIYLGGFLAYRGFSFEKICKRLNWMHSLAAFCIVNYIYYNLLHDNAILMILSFVTFIVMFKLSILLSNNRILLSISASSTYLYLVHIFVLNVSRHSLAKCLVIESDVDMCIYYVLNSAICVIVSLGSYYLLKYLNANKLLKILTGGRA